MLGKCPVLRSSPSGVEVRNTPVIGFSARAEPVALWLNIRRLVYAALGLSVVAGGSSQSLYLNHRLFIGAAHQREPCRDWCRASSRNGQATDGTAAIVLAIFVSTHIDRCSLCRLRCSCCSSIVGRGQSFRPIVAAQRSP